MLLLVISVTVVWVNMYMFRAIVTVVGLCPGLESWDRTPCQMFQMLKEG